MQTLGIICLITLVMSFIFFEMVLVENLRNENYRLRHDLKVRDILMEISADKDQIDQARATMVEHINALNQSLEEAIQSGEMGDETDE